MKKTLDKFQTEIISDFWTFVSAYDICVDWQGGELLMWVEADDIRAFGETFGIQDDTFLECTLMCLDTFCIKVVDIMGGYGFEMTDVKAPESEENP